MMTTFSFLGELSL